MNASRQLPRRLLDQSAAPRRVALIDRDGTIIVDKVYLRDPDGIEFAPGAIEGLRLLRDSGFAFVLITNQSGIARGYLDAQTLERIHERLEFCATRSSYPSSRNSVSTSANLTP